MKDNNYILGLLYGDGYFHREHRYEWYFFSTTHKELSEKVISYLKENSINFFSHSRQYDGVEEKKNYEILEIVEITDKIFKEYLEDKGFLSDKAEERIKWDSDFIRGIIETKGTMFFYKQRNSIAWRVAISGSKEDMTYLKSALEENLGIAVSSLIHRREREDQGVISESYRISIQNREGVRKFVNFIKDGDMSKYLKEQVEEFQKYDAETPFNMKRKVFKHYKYAVGAMAKDLSIVIKGKRGSVGGKKPVYLWDNDMEIACFDGWKNAYKWVSKVYQDQLGYTPPKVSDIDERDSRNVDKI